MSRRYGQLTYTSFDVAGTAGGWQVKESTGQLTAGESDILVAGVRTVFRAVDPLPDYPTPQDCERGPRRLAYRPTAPDAAAFWHTVPAGSDSTGRPGNVFAHAVLDRRSGEHAGLRPIQLWRSPGWVRPYGAPEVARATLPHNPPGPGGVVTADAAIDFVMDTSTWRLGVLCGLLDAVAGALDGGPPVVLGVATGETAAQWIGVVSFLMSAGTATRLSFSTFDRADEVPTDARSGHHLTAVPRGDLAALPPHVVVIDETAMLSLGELGGQPHRTAAGQLIEVTAWSVMAQVALMDTASARAVVDDIDRYANEAGDRGLHPSWPMAMSVLHRDDFADARAEASTVIAQFSPAELGAESTLGQTISGALAELVGVSTEQAWRAVERAPGGRSAEYADAVYLERAAADPAWLLQSAQVPVSPRRYDDREPPAAVTAALGPALRAAAATGPELLIRLADLLLRAGVAGGYAERALADPMIGSALADPQAGPDLVRRLGQWVGGAGRLALAGAILPASAVAGDVMSPFDDAVLSWLVDGVTVPASSVVAAARPGDPTWTRAALRGVYTERHGARDDADRFAHLWWLRLCGAAHFDRLAGGAVWNPADLLVAGHGAPLGAEATLPTLLGAPDSPGLDELASAVLDTGPDLLAVACAAVRVIDPRDWVRAGHVEGLQTRYCPLWEDAMTRIGLGGVHPDFGIRLLTLSIVGHLARAPFPGQAARLAADPASADAAVDRVLSLIDQQVLTPTAVLAAAALVEPGASAGVDAIVARVADQLIGTRDFTDEDIDTTVSRMAEMTGLGADEAPRRYRKMVHRLLAQRPPGQPSLAARIRGGR